jgi:hypothetical protein
MMLVNAEAVAGLVDVVDIGLANSGVRVLHECVNAGAQEVWLQSVVMGGPLDVLATRKFEGPIEVG